MNAFFQFETEEDRQQLLSRARNVALKALQLYDLDWNCIRFIQLSDTITYKIETETMGNYLLRIHSDQFVKEEIISEIVFLNELKLVHDLQVPIGIASRTGLYVLEGETEGDYRRPYVSLMSWIEGEPIGRDLTDHHVYQTGVLMGKLHEASERFDSPENFVRPHWEIDRFKKQIHKLEKYYSRFLTNEGWERYQSAINKIEYQLDAISRSDQNYGLIHADLHSGNVVYHNDIPHPIDFGRLGYGYYLYDMAGALLELTPNQRKIFIQGYESVKSIDSNFERLLECFFVMCMIENYCHHSNNPLEIPGLIKEQKYAQAYIEEYIQDKPFLFERIKPLEIIENDIDN